MPRLVDSDVLLGLTSGALEAGAHIKLARAGLNRYFCFGGYGSDSRDRAELTRRAMERAGQIHGHALDPRRVLVVGDTPLDVAPCSTTPGMPSISAEIRSGSAIGPN